MTIRRTLQQPGWGLYIKALRQTQRSSPQTHIFFSQGLLSFYNFSGFVSSDATASADIFLPTHFVFVKSWQLNFDNNYLHLNVVRFEYMSEICGCAVKSYLKTCIPRKGEILIESLGRSPYLPGHINCQCFSVILNISKLNLRDVRQKNNVMDAVPKHLN